MSPRGTDQRLQDILQAIQAIEDHRLRAQAVGLSHDEPLLLDAIVRQLAVIGEAASHLPADVTDRHRGIPWRGVRACASSSITSTTAPTVTSSGAQSGRSCRRYGKRSAPRWIGSATDGDSKPNRTAMPESVYRQVRARRDPYRASRTVDFS